MGAVGEVSPDAVRALTVGDREALVLHLRRLTLGDRFSAVINCPSPGCGEPMDLDLRVSDLLLSPYADPRAFHEAVLPTDRGSYQVRFRLPDGGDQEGAAALAGRGMEAVPLILGRCVRSIVLDGEPVSTDDLPADAVARLSEVMAELDPQAELLLRLNCPECGHEFTSLLDAASFFFQEVADRVGHLFHEVHRIASNYHWSEAAILGMTARRRQVYLALIGDDLNARTSR